MTITSDDIGKLVLRLTLGILILLHGIAKLMHGVDPILGAVRGAGLPHWFAYGVYLGEVVGPLLLLFGFYARVGAALIAANMVAAILLVHTTDFFHLTKNGGWQLELQGMYLLTACALVLTGPGRFSINRR